MLAGQGTDVTGTDMISSIQTRLSMQARRSTGSRISVGSRGHSDRDGLMRAYDLEQGDFGLNDLTEDSEDESSSRRNGSALNLHPNSKGHESIELQTRKSAER